MQKRTDMLCFKATFSFVQLSIGYLRLQARPNTPKKKIMTAERRTRTMMSTMPRLRPMPIMMTLGMVKVMAMMQWNSIFDQRTCFIWIGKAWRIEILFPSSETDGAVMTLVPPRKPMAKKTAIGVRAFNINKMAFASTSGEADCCAKLARATWMVSRFTMAKIPTIGKKM